MKKMLCFMVAFSFSCCVWSAYDTQNGIVLCNCLPKVPEECITFCKSIRLNQQIEDDNTTMCSCG